MIKKIENIIETRTIYLNEIEANNEQIYVDSIVLAAKIIRTQNLWIVDQMLYKKDEQNQWIKLNNIGDDLKKIIGTIVQNYYKSATFHIRNVIINEILFLLNNEFVCPKFENDRHFLVFNNGILNLKNNIFQPIDPLLINEIPLIKFNFNYNQNQTIPEEFNKLFNWWSQNKDENKTFLKQMLGALISGLQQEYIFNFYGVEASGKSLLINFLESIIGHDFCVMTKIKSLSDRFGTTQILRKKLIIESDAATTEEIEPEMIKKITGNDSILFEIKNGGFINKKVETNILITSNEILKFRGSFQGMNRRLIVYSFPYSTINFNGKNLGFEPLTKKELNSLREFKNGHWYFKTQLLESFIAECLKEFSNVINNNNKFSISHEMKESKFEIEINSNPILYYLLYDFKLNDSNFDKDNINMVYFQKGNYLYDQYKAWAFKNGYKSYGKNTFLNIFAKTIKSQFGYDVFVNKHFKGDRYFVISFENVVKKS